MATNAVNGAKGKLPGIQVATDLAQKGDQGLKGLYDLITNQITLIKGNAYISTVIHENGNVVGGLTDVK